jgi:type IV pilus assembly protein PilC
MPKKKKELSPLEQKINLWVAMHLTRISLAEKIFFIDHLRTMIHAGISLVESLNILGKEMDNKKFQHLILEVTAQVEQGEMLHDALAAYPKVFPSAYVSMIASGEQAGRLEESLEQIVTQMKKTHALRSSIRGAMVYPIVVLTAMGGLGVMMITTVLPKLLEVFKEFDGAEIPLATRVLIYVTDRMTDPILMSIVIGGAIIALMIFTYCYRHIPAFTRFIHALLLRLPIFGPVFKQVNLAQFSMTLSSMMKSTVPIIEGLRITSETCGNKLYQEALHGSIDEITKGTPLSEILRESPRLFPPMVTEMIMVGERSGQVDHLLSELAQFYADEVDHTMKNFTTIIEPVIILVLGVAVGGMAVAVIMPMYSLAQSF